MLNWSPETAPANDHFINAQVISGPAGSVTGTNVGASKEAGEPNHANTDGTRSIWYRWTAPSTNKISITTAGSNFDTSLAVYTGAGVNALSLVVSNDDFASDSTSSVTFSPAAGTTYSIAVDGSWGAIGSVMLNWQPSNSGPEPTDVTFSTLYHFTNNAGGYWPEGTVIAIGNRLFGTTMTHNPGAGTLFALNADGSGFTVLKSFNGGADGANPFSELTPSGDTLFGTVSAGGTNFRGAVFSIKTNGAAFKVLHTFTTTSGTSETNSDGAGPRGGLALSGQTLFGVAQTGGNFGAGTLFSVATNGTGFTTLHHFPALAGASETNSQGGKPVTTLVVAGNTLYGVAVVGGASGYGTVFSLNTNGSGFTTLRQFNGTDGNYPRALILAGNTLYGTTSDSVFAMNTNGTGFTNLARFIAAGTGSPYGPITLSGDRIYGTTSSGGTAGIGTVYTVRTNGTGFVTLHEFPGQAGPLSTNTDGSFPRGLSISGNALYGTAQNGGNWSYGTVFRLTFPLPTLTIVRSGTNLLLKWPASPGGFNLQTATNLSLPAPWITNASAPTVLGGENVITNRASNPQQFYRLQQ